MLDKIDNFLEEVKEAIFEGAYDWVDEHCRKKLKKYPLNIKLHLYLCVNAFKNKQYGRVINKACKALELCKIEDINTLALRQLLFLSLKQLKEDNIHPNIIQKAKLYSEKIDVLISENLDQVKHLIEEDPDIFREIFYGCATIERDIEKEKNIGFDMILDDNDLMALEYFTKSFGPSTQDESVKAAIAFLFNQFDESVVLCDKILTKNQEPKILALKAKSLYELGRYDKALVYLKKSINSGLKNMTLFFEAANCLVELNRKDEAIKLFDKALEIEPKNVAILTNKGGALSELGFYNEAIKCFDKALKVDPSDSFLLQNKGIALKNLNRYDEAIESFIKLSEQLNDSSLLVGTAQELELKGMLNKARRCYEEVLKKQENNEYALIGLVNYMVNKYNPNKEKKIFEYCSKLIKESKNESILNNVLGALKIIGADTSECSNRILIINPNNQFALVEKGIMLTGQGKYKQAITYLEKTEGIVKSTHEEYFFSRAICLEKLGEYKQGKRYYKKLLKINKNNKAAINGTERCNVAINHQKKLAKKKQSLILLEEVGDYEKALNVCNYLLKQNVNDEQVLEKKADYLLKLKREKEAFECYNELIDLTKEEAVVVNILGILKKFNVEINKCYEKLAGINPDNDLVLIRKGTSLTNEKKYYNALEFFDRVKGDYEDDTYLRCKVFCLQLSKRYEEAVKYYRKLIEKKMEDSDLLFNYFYCLFKIKDYTLAKVCLTRLLEGSEDVLVKVDLLPITEKENKEIKCFILEYLAMRAESEKNFDKSIIYYNKILEYGYNKNVYKKIKDILDNNEDHISVNTKSSLIFDFWLKELIICDSNILIFKVFYDLKGIMNILEDQRCQRAFDRFQELTRNNFITLTDTIKKQVELVWLSLFDTYKPKIRHNEMIVKGQIIRRIEKYKRYYAIKNLFNKPLVISAKELEEVEDFYKKYPDRLKEITERKISSLSESDKTKKLMLRSNGELPEKSDMYILAQAIKLNNSNIKGIKKIAIFSDDNDFCDFSNEIEERFNVKIYSL